MKVQITDIQKFAIYDGPGIRSTVFFAGCTMRCQWCQNPETQSGKNQLLVDAGKCIHCMACMAVCEHQACQTDALGNILVMRDRCVDCMKCTTVCPSTARRAASKEIEVDSLLAILEKDHVFYAHSNGGVTLSGGEAILQNKGCLELLQKLKAAGIHTAVETAGYYKTELLEQVLPFTDLFLFDLKCMDPNLHRQYTGVENAQILQNFIQAASKKEVILRVALIPGINDGKEFEKIIQFVKQYTTVSRVDLLPFHQMGDAKYIQLGWNYQMAGKDTRNEQNIRNCKRYAQSCGLDVQISGEGN